MVFIGWASSKVNIIGNGEMEKVSVNFLSVSAVCGGCRSAMGVSVRRSVNFSFFLSFLKPGIRFDNFINRKRFLVILLDNSQQNHWPHKRQHATCKSFAPDKSFGLGSFCW